MNKRNPPSKPYCVFARYDYMFDQNLKKFMQIEYNLMAVSLGYHVQNSQKMIKLVNKLFLNKDVNLLGSNYSQFHVDTLVYAYNLYGNKDAYICIAMDKNEQNIMEHLQISSELVERNVNIMFLEKTEIDPINYKINKNQRLFIKGKEIALLYLRTLYDADHYNEVNTEFIITAESSHTMLIPNATLYLASLKAIQILFFNKNLAKRYNLENLLNSRMSDNITPTYILKETFNNDKKKMIKFIYENGGPKRYLMKSFREGGFGDIIGDDNLIKFIEEKDKKFLNDFILVYRIDTPIYKSIVLEGNDIVEHPKTLSEFGFYAGYVIDKNSQGKFEMVYKAEDSVLIRTKKLKTLKGGVAVNASFIDNFGLFDSKLNKEKLLIN